MHTPETTEVEIDQADADDIARRIGDQYEGLGAAAWMIGATMGTLFGGLLAFAIARSLGWCP